MSRQSIARSAAPVEEDDFPNPMPEYLADKYMGTSYGTAKKLRRLKILKPQRGQISTAVGPVKSWLNTKADLSNVKKCIDTVKRLKADGFVEAVDGELFVIKADFKSDGNHLFQLMNFGAQRGKLFTLKSAASKYGIPLSRLRAAAWKGENIDPQVANDQELKINSIRVYPCGTKGGDWLVALFEFDLDEFMENDKPKVINHDQYKSTEELSAMADAIERLTFARGIGRRDATDVVAKIWRHWSRLSTKGRIDGINAADIDNVVGRPGFCEELVAVGWMTTDANGIKLHAEPQQKDRDGLRQAWITLKIEVSECLRRWKEMGLQTRNERIAFDGVVPAEWHRDDDGNRIPSNALTTTNRRRNCTRYHVNDFLRRWNDDLKKRAGELRTLVFRGKSSNEIDAEMNKNGILGERLKRILRLAGVVKEAGSYVQKHSHSTPILKRLAQGTAETWLRQLLVKGPRYLPLIRDEADPNRKASSNSNDQMKITHLHEAFAQLKGKAHYVYKKPIHGRGIVRHAFWFLPGDEMKLPTDDEARRIIDQYAVSQHAKARTHDHDAPGPIPNVNGASTALPQQPAQAAPVPVVATDAGDEKLTASRLKQKWCYEQYHAVDAKGNRKKIVTILKEAANDCPGRPPRSDPEIITYASDPTTPCPPGHEAYGAPLAARADASRLHSASSRLELVRAQPGHTSWELAAGAGGRAAPTGEATERVRRLRSLRRGGAWSTDRRTCIVRATLWSRGLPRRVQTMMAVEGKIRLPPHDVGAERAMLGSMLRDSSIIAEAIGLVRPDEYYTCAHGLIHQTIAAMHADGRPVDLVTLGSRLLDDHQEAEIGGLGYLVTLNDAAPCAGHYREYAAAIRDAAVRRHAERAAGNPTATIVGVIASYLARRYRPIFRRGANLWSESLGREITRADACAAPTSDLIPALLVATDYPRDQDGPRRNMVPTVYRQWAPIAWQDLLTALPDEPDSPEIGETAGEQFRRGVADLMSTIESLAYRREGTEHTEIQRRSLVDWCRLFAQPGPWRSIRSLRIWCRLDADGGLEIAYHHQLYAQVHRGNLAPLTHRRLVELCQLYGVGTGTRTSRSAMVQLAPEFIAELLAGPCDGDGDGKGDAASTRARARTNDASHPPSHAPSHGPDDVSDSPSGGPSTEGKR